ncbi:hypothetical protein [Sinomonas sp. ASV322]|uniref:hypothetical protein n=1 Tax=Sinomonas sp. ASV322 TaxID=3041920 RepID=UPI0027DDFDF1|nr:hypothetical protein [Sinomonas sp. ASV322]MDQ4502200.1 hypothetical protein [Sinomonas sp. ASV322]
MVVIVWLPPLAVIAVSALFTVTGSVIVRDGKKRLGAVERFRWIDLQTAGVVGAVMLAASIAALVARFGPLPSWSGWLVAVGAALSVSAVMLPYDRALSRRIRAGR